jgi:hypothetical protein
MGMNDETRTNVHYELLGHDERGEIRRYQDGTLRDQNGRARTLVPSMVAQQITAETAHTMHKLRKQKILDAIESKLKDVTKTKIPADAIAAIVGKRAQIAMTDDTRTGNEAAKIVLAAVDAYQDKATEQTMVTRNEYAMDADTRQLLESILESRRENNGEVLDATTTRNDENNNAE